MIQRHAILCIIMGLTVGCLSPKPTARDTTQARPAPTQLSGVHYNPPRALQDIRALDHHGERFVLSRQPHPLSMVFFGYVGCTDVCPTNLKRFERIQALLGERAAQIQFIFVTIDPEREGPAKMREHLEQLGGEIIGVTGSAQVLTQVYEQWGITREKIKVDHAVDSRGYKFDHTGQIFLVRQGKDLLTSYPYGSSAQLMAADLGALLDDPGLAHHTPATVGVRELIIPPNSFTKRAQERPTLPAYIKLRPGESIRWINKDYMYHTVGDIRLAPESDATQTFHEPGTFYLGCTALPEETIRIKVEGAPLRVHTIKIPPGTYANRRAANFPSSIEIEVGDTVVWSNDDHYFHVIGDLTLAPDERASQQFQVAGEYTFGCSALPKAIMHLRVRPQS